MNHCCKGKYDCHCLPDDLQLLLMLNIPNPFGFLGLQEANGQLLVEPFVRTQIIDHSPIATIKAAFSRGKKLLRSFFERDWRGESRFDYPARSRALDR